MLFPSNVNGYFSNVPVRVSKVVPLMLMKIGEVGLLDGPGSSIIHTCVDYVTNYLRSFSNFLYFIIF